jgi:hypothetical protein
MSKDKKVIHIKLKYTLPNYDKIHINYNYPIKSFLNGDGYWTYTDVDKRKYNQYKPISYICHNDGERCHTWTDYIRCECFDKADKCQVNENEEYYKPTIKPKDLLNIDTWKKIYYYQEGENNWKEWIIACKNKDNVYVYFRASCDYTGFDCQGGGDVSYSKDRNTFWNYCLDQFGRNLILAENGIKIKIDIPK